ncbi:hypothetical protein [Priestia megaterium]|uniref:hypothetical protein n=1 Tax=Priestia megaterium TaxID=1404 RepID=UPI00112C8C94|nr:hypothetical protein [Priestia megaterium]TPF18106.1 hypothetical protein CBE78_02430 [Priestia megaterium]TPF22213.1 hypothetical protein CBE79_04935 [Priestia megaterium]
MEELVFDNLTGYINHLKHMVKEKCGEEFAAILNHDIEATMIGAVKYETMGAINNMRSTNAKNLMLTKEKQQLEKFITENVHIDEN